MNYKLGKTPARPNAVGLKFGAFFNAEKLPTPPAKFGHYGLGLGLNWGVLANDKYSDCVFAGAAHETMVWTHRSGAGQPVDFDDEAVLADYAAVTGFDPADPSTDQGTDMVEAASYRRKVGIADATGARHRIYSYVALHAGDADQLALATYLMGATAVGLRFPESAEKQFDKSEPWDYVIGSRLQGGHYVPCLHGDTKISLLDGKEVAIKDLVGTTQWVYSIDKHGRVVPALAQNIRRTKRNARIFRVHLDNGEHFDCTPDHLIMLRDGRYIRAEKLTLNQSLMPLYRRVDKYGYEHLLNPSTETWHSTHRVVAALHGLKPKLVVHHVDYDKRNNRPDNLQLMSWDAHTKLHSDNCQQLKDYASSEEGRDRSRHLMRQNWENPDFRARHNHHLQTNPKIAQHRKDGFYDREAQRSNGKKTGPINIKLAHTPAAEARRIEVQRVRLQSDPVLREKKVAIARQNGSKLARLTKEQISYVTEHLKDAPYGTSAALAKELGVSRPLISRIKNGQYINHKVIAVEVLSGTHDVFDLEVPKYHNFAISPGVFVHNCVGRNSDGNFLIVTWGRLQAMTPAFLKNYCDEAMAYVSIELLKNDLSPEGFNSDQLRRDLSAITN